MFYVFFSVQLFSQSLQLHYDPRHTTDPKRNEKNFVTLFFEYFKSQDSGTSFIKPGSFLIKMQADFIGEQNNLGKFYMQASQSFRFWKPKVFVHFEYSGGLGVTEPKQYSFYISNSFSLGVDYPFQWKNAYFNVNLCYKYNVFKKPSHDLLSSFYWWKSLLNYKMEFSGDVEIWTQNKNHGDDYTSDLSGKRISLYGEPQVWFSISKSFSFGSKANIYYHVLINENILQIYPTVAVKYKL